MRALPLAVVSLVVAACGGDEVWLSQRVRQASIYGPDDRTEVVDAAEPWRSMGEHSVVSLLRPKTLAKRQLDFCGGSPATYGGPTVGEENGLCPSVRFQDQPAVAGCSTTLVAPTLLLTAKHCVVEGVRYMALTDFVMRGDGGLPELTTDDVYAVKRVLVSDTQDLAMLELATPISGGQVVPIATTLADVGEPVTVIGYANGGPAKVSSACHVLRSAGERLGANCEVFPGNSGSGLFDATGALTGVVVSTGIGVSRATDAGCKIDFVYTDAGFIIEGVGAPQLTMAVDPRRFVGELCDGGLASTLCGRVAQCGDGLCTDDETSASCAVDCSASRCGDGLCAGGEVIDCEADCAEAACSYVPVVDAGVTPDPQPEPQGCSTGVGAAAWLALLVTRSRNRTRRAACGR